MLKKHEGSDENVSPYKNSNPHERLLPKLKARMNRMRRNHNLSLHERFLKKAAEEMDFRKLIQSIFDKSNNIRAFLQQNSSTLAAQRVSKHRNQNSSFFFTLEEEGGALPLNTHYG
jgi:hypothetical protein